MSFFKSNENIHKKEDVSYYVVSAHIASSVTKPALLTRRMKTTSIDAKSAQSDQRLCCSLPG